MVKSCQISFDEHKAVNFYHLNLIISLQKLSIKIVWNTEEVFCMSIKQRWSINEQSIATTNSNFTWMNMKLHTFLIKFWSMFEWKCVWKNVWNTEKVFCWSKYNVYRHNFTFNINKNYSKTESVKFYLYAHKAAYFFYSILINAAMKLSMKNCLK